MRTMMTGTNVLITASITAIVVMLGIGLYLAAKHDIHKTNLCEEAGGVKLYKENLCVDRDVLIKGLEGFKI